jgi:hypothetical protein
MKVKLSFFIIFLLAVSTVWGQSEQVGDRLHKLFVLCFTDNYKDASKYIVYRGADTTRKWKDVYDFDREDEKKEIISVCKEIKSYLEEGGDYELTDFSQEEESEGKWYVWLVEFKKGSHRKVHFAFLKIGKKYALGDID